VDLVCASEFLSHLANSPLQPPLHKYNIRGNMDSTKYVSTIQHQGSEGDTQMVSNGFQVSGAGALSITY
jgi:hypothetical protein